MIANLQPYPEYKNSGIPWLGKIPACWDVRRMKLLLREVDSRSSTGKEQLLRVSQYTGVTQRKSIEGSDAPYTRASSLVGYKRVSHDDLVINIMLAWNGSMGVSRHEGIASPAYCVYRFKGHARPWYYHELLRLPLYKGRIKTASTGVVESRLRLYSYDLGDIEALQPPADEQDVIVRFLDYANGQVGRAPRRLPVARAVGGTLCLVLALGRARPAGRPEPANDLARDTRQRTTHHQAGDNFRPPGSLGCPFGSHPLYNAPPLQHIGTHPYGGRVEHRAIRPPILRLRPWMPPCQQAPSPLRPRARSRRSPANPPD